MVEKSGVGMFMVEKSAVEMSFNLQERGHFNPGLFNHELFNPMVQKFMVEKSGVEKFVMVIVLHLLTLICNFWGTNKL